MANFTIEKIIRSSFTEHNMAVKVKYEVTVENGDERALGHDFNEELMKLISEYINYYNYK